MHNLEQRNVLVLKHMFFLRCLTYMPLSFKNFFFKLWSECSFHIEQIGNIRIQSIHV